MTRAATKTRDAQAEAPKASPKARANCIHHWIIDAPNGRESQGSCKRCGVTKSFANSTEQVMWEQTNTLRSEYGRSAFRSSKNDEVSLADEA
jgi:hypothetical protein